MSVLSLACCLVGLPRAAYRARHGVERRHAVASPVPPHEAAGTYDAAAGPSPVLDAQAAAALVVALVARWAIPGARDEAVDERDLLQEHPAQVTQAVAPDGRGEIAHVARGRRRPVAARRLDGGDVPAPAVATGRVEGGVATYVERWTRVEARL